MSTGPLRTSNARKTVNKYTTSLIVFISGTIFFSLVPFLPAAPFLPALVAAGLAGLSLKKAELSNAILCILIFFAIFWQINGFGIFNLFRVNPVGTLFLYIILIVPLFMTKIKNTIAVPLASLAAALMLTPYYYLSVPIIGAAAFIAGLAEISVLAFSYILYLLPFLIVENALRFSAQVSDRLPIVFDQMVNFVGQIRPPLTSLNIISSGLPTDYLSARAPDVIAVLSGVDALVILTPLLIFGVVAIVAVELSAFSRRLVAKLKVFEMFENMPNWLPSLTVPIILSATFFVLIVALSPANIGGYKAPFVNTSEAIIMVLAALAFGAIFTGREILIGFLERTEFARDRLLQLIEDGTTKVGIGRAVIAKVLSGAPSIDLTHETKIADSCSSSAADMKKNMSTADYQTLTKWIESAEASVADVNNIPELTRVKLATELSTLSVLVSTYNASLQEVGLDERFNNIDVKIHETGIDQALGEYKKALQNIRETIATLYDNYVKAVQAYGKIAKTEAIMPTVNPLTILDSNDTLMALKITCDEYWLSFHTRRKDELNDKTTKLLNTLTRLKNQLGIPEDQQYNQFFAFMSNVRPSDAPEILNNLKSLRLWLTNSVASAKNENEKLNNLVGRMLPTASKVMDFESLDQERELKNLYEDVNQDKNSLDEMTQDTDVIISVLGNYEVSKKRDTERIVIISQYPLARRIIEATLNEKGSLAASKLPFQKNVSSVYLRLYSASTPSVKYDDETEEIRSA